MVSGGAGVGAVPRARGLSAARRLLPLLARVDERVEAAARGTPAPWQWSPVAMGDAAAKLIASEFVFIEPSTPLCAEALERFGRFRMTAIHSPRV